MESAWCSRPCPRRGNEGYFRGAGTGGSARSAAAVVVRRRVVGRWPGDSIRTVMTSSICVSRRTGAAGESSHSTGAGIEREASQSRQTLGLDGSGAAIAPPQYLQILFLIRSDGILPVPESAGQCGCSAYRVGAESAPGVRVKLPLACQTRGPVALLRTRASRRSSSPVTLEATPGAWK